MSQEKNELIEIILNPQDDSLNLFYKKINSFPKPAQELISALSSLFLENDLYHQFKEDRQSMEDLQNRLAICGLQDHDINDVMNFFNLSLKYLSNKGQAQ